MLRSPPVHLKNALSASNAFGILSLLYAVSRFLEDPRTHTPHTVRLSLINHLRQPNAAPVEIGEMFQLMQHVNCITDIECNSFNFGSGGILAFSKDQEVSVHIGAYGDRLVCEFYVCRNTSKTLCIKFEDPKALTAFSFVAKYPGNKITADRMARMFDDLTMGCRDSKFQEDAESVFHPDSHEHMTTARDFLKAWRR